MVWKPLGIHETDSTMTQGFIYHYTSRVGLEMKKDLQPTDEDERNSIQDLKFAEGNSQSVDLHNESGLWLTSNPGTVLSLL